MVISTFSSLTLHIAYLLTLSMWLFMRLSYSFICFLAFVFFSMTVVLFSSSAVQAAGKCDLGKIEVGIPGNPGIVKGQEVCDTSFSVLMGTIVNAATGLVIVAGLMSIIIGGYFYMTAGGDSGRISTAKTFFMSAFLGILLALTAYIILNTISPQFASQLKEPVLEFEE